MLSGRFELPDAINILSFLQDRKLEEKKERKMKKKGERMKKKEHEKEEKEVGTVMYQLIFFIWDFQIIK
jgi:hypothetical protein